MSDLFVYEELDLQSPSFRLVRLYGGHEGPIECELLHAYVGDDEAGMEYEALSYTWGDLDTPHRISVNGQAMHITKNLFDVLEHLRLKYEDRFLWIDALCINQQDYKERGHQVRQMASIYERGRQVIFWLGLGTPTTDGAFECLRMFEKAALSYSCNNWRPSDERWRFIWSTVELQLKTEAATPAFVHSADFQSLLDRSWFSRIWIIQEVAKARSARVICGTKSVSARIFALLPALTDIEPSPQCQAILDIMPGPSRKFSWWLTDQDLETLLRKFAGSQASDPRDMVYALLGISADVHCSKSLNPDYNISEEEVVRHTISFLLDLDGFGISSTCLPPDGLTYYLQEFPRFIDLRESIIIDVFNKQRNSKLWSHGPSQEIEFVQERWKAGQTMEDVVQLVKSPGNNGWALLLDTDQRHTDHLDVLSQEGLIMTPVLWAAKQGREDLVELFLASGAIDFKDWKSHRELLFEVVESGYEQAMRLLLERQDVKIDAVNSFGETLLHLAVAGNFNSIARMLLEARPAMIVFPDSSGRTPLTSNAQRTTPSMAKLLLASKSVDLNMRDLWGNTPLIAAAERGDADMVDAILDFALVDGNTHNSSGRPLLAAAANTSQASDLGSLADSRICHLNTQNKKGLTALAAAVQNNHFHVVELLLSARGVNVNIPQDHWLSQSGWQGEFQPIEIPIREGNLAMVRLLLGSGKVDMDFDNKRRMLTSLSFGQTHKDEMRSLLESFSISESAISKQGAASGS